MRLIHFITNCETDQTEMVTTLAEYLDRISKLDGEYIYRGQASKEWELIPSVGRSDMYSLEIEKDALTNFKMKYHFYSNERCENDMDVLFLAQHHGLSTRLLDWSYNPLVALYFACESETDKDGKIFIFSLNGKKLGDSQSSEDNHCPHTFNEILSNNSKNEFEIVVPNYTNNRYVNQKTLFMLCNRPDKGVQNAKCNTIIVDKSRKGDILRDLAKVGVDKVFIYPTLESLSSEIMRKLEHSK